jgi:thiamine transport system permease protein
LRFTVVQALVSGLISIAVAIPTARALARRRFPGRQFMVTLLGAPFILPSIVAVEYWQSGAGRDTSVKFW